MNAMDTMDASEVHSCRVSKFDGSIAYRAQAVNVLAKGVSSTPRAAQLPVPPVIVKGEGAIVTDVDGNRYIDYTLGYGPLILGHSPQPVLDAVRAALDQGLRTAAVHTAEADLARRIAEMVPCAHISSFVTSGTEAVQLALRIARSVTGKLPVLKFRANYHGWFDNVHIANAVDSDGPSSTGQDPDAASSMVLADWGDSTQLEALLNADFAAVILEPVAINAGCFMPPAGFLHKLRDLTKKHNVVLIFDEVISGFRLTLGGASQWLGITPDIAVLGKALGAGLPISAVTGSREVMAPLTDGRVLHRGTFNGNPLSVQAAVACLDHLRAQQDVIYPRMHAFANALKTHVNEEAKRHHADVCANAVGSAVQLFAGVHQLDMMAELPRADKVKILQLTKAFLENGLMPLPRGLMYLSSAHDAPQIEATKSAISRAIGQYVQATASQ